MTNDQAPMTNDKANLPLKSQDGKCRECGCTDRGACAISAVPCFWVQPDLCSGCATVAQVLESVGGLAWLLAVAADITRQMDRELADRARWQPAEEVLALECDHPWHSNRGLITDCPSCGESP